MADAEVDVAVRALHDAHAPALRAWARRHTDDARQVDDIVQETFVLAWRKQHQFDPARGSERAWLFGIARNVAVDQHRRRQRHLRAVPDTRPPDGSGENEVEEPIDRAVETSLVRDALGALSEDHRRVVIEAYFHGRSMREIAEQLEIPVGTVKSRLHHALRALRTELERVEVLP